MPKKKKGQFAFFGELKILAYQALKDARTDCARLPPARTHRTMLAAGR
jgi:hypothetical protein